METPDMEDEEDKKIAATGLTPTSWIIDIIIANTSESKIGLLATDVLDHSQKFPSADPCGQIVQILENLSVRQLFKMVVAWRKKGYIADEIRKDLKRLLSPDLLQILNSEEEERSDDEEAVEDLPAPHGIAGYEWRTIGVTKQKEVLSFFIKKDIDHRGGEVNAAGVKLFIPPGALSKKETIKLGLPYLKTHRSNNVSFEPQGLKFNKPARLSISHYDSTLKKYWKGYSVGKSETSPDWDWISNPDIRPVWYSFEINWF